MSQLAKAPAPAPAKGPSLRTQLIGVVDRVPATRGCGVCYRKGDKMIRLRPQGNSGATVVFELHERSIKSFYLQHPAAGRGPLRYPPSPGKTSIPGWPVTAAPTRPLATIPKRDAGSSVKKEWLGLGLNCGGAALAWIGVVGFGAAAPATGGASGFVSGFLYAGAAAGSAQCVASVYRVRNAHTGRQTINDKLDASPVYQYSMLAADGLGMASAGFGVKASLKAAKALRSAGIGSLDAVGVGQAARNGIDAASRRSFNAAMGFQATNVGTRVINSLVRRQLLDAAGAVLGTYSSIKGGVVRELIVWILEEKSVAAR